MIPQAKAKMSTKALRKLLKPKEKQILAMGYKNLDSFIEQLKKVPVDKLLAKKKELDKDKEKEK